MLHDAIYDDVTYVKCLYPPLENFPFSTYPLTEKLYIICFRVAEILPFPKILIFTHHGVLIAFLNLVHKISVLDFFSLVIISVIYLFEIMVLAYIYRYLHIFVLFVTWIVKMYLRVLTRKISKFLSRNFLFFFLHLSTSNTFFKFFLQFCRNYYCAIFGEFGTFHENQEHH